MEAQLAEEGQGSSLLGILIPFGAVCGQSASPGLPWSPLFVAGRVARRAAVGWARGVGAGPAGRLPVVRTRPGRGSMADRRYFDFGSSVLQLGVAQPRRGARGLCGRL